MDRLTVEDRRVRLDQNQNPAGFLFFSCVCKWPRSRPSWQICRHWGKSGHLWRPASSWWLSWPSWRNDCADCHRTRTGDSIGWLFAHLPSRRWCHCGEFPNQRGPAQIMNNLALLHNILKCIYCNLLSRCCSLVVNKIVGIWTGGVVMLRWVWKPKRLSPILLELLMRNNGESGHEYKPDKHNDPQICCK